MIVVCCVFWGGGTDRHLGYVYGVVCCVLCLEVMMMSMEAAMERKMARRKDCKITAFLSVLFSCHSPDMSVLDYMRCSAREVL